LRQARDTAEAKLVRATKDQKDTAAAAEKLKTDLDAAAARATELERAAKSGATAKDAVAGEVRAAKEAQQAAERQLAGLKNEVTRLRRDLDEAEKFGPFQAFAGRWQSREKLGDIAVVSISIKGNGSCWAGTAAPAGGGGGQLPVQGGTAGGEGRAARTR
jgi:chromosome segregation ATPase